MNSVNTKGCKTFISVPEYIENTFNPSKSCRIKRPFLIFQLSNSPSKRSILLSFTKINTLKAES